MTPPLNSEWSSSFSGDVPDSIAALGERIGFLVGSLQTPTAGQEQGAFAVPDRARIVSIFGGRGTGKSTILQFSAHSLAAEPDHVVLSVIDPEAFSPGDSLVGWVLAQLDQEFSDSDREFESDDCDRSLGQQLDDLRRAQAARGSFYFEGLEQRGLSVDDFSRDAVKLPTYGVRAPSQISALLDNFALARQQPKLRIVIPVDDADLYPDLLPGIVGDAQLLSASQRVVLLFAADREILAQSLQMAALSSRSNSAATALANGILTAGDVRNAVARRLVKHFPRSLRVELPSLSPAERLDFRPLVGSSETLLEALAKIVNPFDSDRPLSGLFIICNSDGVQLGVSPYAECFSDNIRDIRQLHEAISSVPEGEEDAAKRAIGMILKHGLDGLEPELPPDANKAIVLLGTDSNPRLDFDFRGIAHGKRARSGIRAFVRRDTSSVGLELDNTLEVEGSNSSLERWPVDQPMSKFVELCRVISHYSSLPSVSSESNKDNDGSTHGRGWQDAKADDHELPSQFTYLSFLAWEAAHLSKGEDRLLETNQVVKRLARPGGRNWANVIRGSDTGPAWAYWTVPDWEQASDFFVYQFGWDLLIDAFSLPGDAPASGEWLELALLVHLGLVIGVQLSRGVPVWIADLDHEEVEKYLDPKRWHQRRSELQASIERELRSSHSAARDSALLRDSDFKRWVEREMVLLASPLLTTPVLAEWIFDLWRGLSSDRARESAAGIIAGYARDHMATDMADGDIALLARIEGSDPALKVRTPSLSDVRSNLRHEQAQMKRTMIGSLKEIDTVDTSVIDALEREGATVEVVEALISARLSPSDLSTIAEAFPVLHRETEVKADPSSDPPGL